MKVEAFVQVLRPHAETIAFYGNAALSARMNALADAWTPIMSWNVKDLLRRGWPTEPLALADEASVEEFRVALVRLREVVRSVAKQDVIKDLSALIEALEPRDREDLDGFIEACRLALATTQATTRKVKSSKKPPPIQPADESRVAEFVRQLKESYKDAAGFMPLFQRLSTDKTVTQAEMAAIATLFAYETPAKTKRAESLRRIWHVHESYSASAAKSKFSGGKSAA